ncbi:glycosyltransferase family 39 protein [Rhabdochromatium marinum]|uniref:glycosyltransferase family 39 protein n=1 Tax=Rhabdochromatium marinum TaxID=48729 RepID=UPI001907C1C6|nr:glycosyltransferase family 39 protein [Rhabdochromatium marinum]MBK1649865.1 hypothetical protein [Rhabdochromatium marinum]
MKIDTSRLFAVPVLVAVIAVVSMAKFVSSGSDPAGTLLVSETLLTHGTLKLDHYGPEVLSRYGYRVREKNGHYYYYFPLGTSLASLPFVAMAKGFGFEMAIHEAEVQRVIAALTSALTVVLLIALARLFLEPLNAILISAIFWAGSSLASTSGGGLWSHNFAILFALGAIYTAIRATRLQQAGLWPVIAITLFLAYLCRPTMALLAPFLLLYLFSDHRLNAIKAGLLLAALLGGFMLFSVNEFGQLLPDYYLPGRLSTSHIQIVGGTFSDALYGNLFSPARGLLIYSPFILVVWLCLGQSDKPWGLKRSWLLIGLAWPLAHWVVVSNFSHWWGGQGFGARLMSDSLPGLFLLTLYSWPTALRGRFGKAATGLLAIASIFAILVNTGQGLFGYYANIWAAQPSVDDHPWYLFDWHYPQLLASKRGHERRLAQNAQRTISFDSADASFIGWCEPEATQRWSSGTTSEMTFRVDGRGGPYQGIFHLQAFFFGRQRVTMLLNGVEIYQGQLAGNNVHLTVDFPPDLLRNGENSVIFRLPDAVQASDTDTRVLGLAFEKLRYD